MKIRLLFLLLCIPFGIVLGQNSKKKIKHDFTNYKNGSNQKLKSGKFIDLELNSGDTTCVFSGIFLKLESDSIFMEIISEDHFWESDDYEETYELRKDLAYKKMAFHKSEIEKWDIPLFLMI